MLFYYSWVSLSTGRLSTWRRRAWTPRARPRPTPTLSGPASLPSSPRAAWPPGPRGQRPGRGRPARVPSRGARGTRAGVVGLRAGAGAGPAPSAVRDALCLPSRVISPRSSGFSHVSSGKPSLGPRLASAPSFPSLVEPCAFSFPARCFCATIHFCVGLLD